MILHFGLRGRENLRSLEKDTFKVEVDEDEKEYVAINKVMKYKNVKCSLSQKEFCDNKNSHMYEFADKNKCSVNAFKTYMELLPKNTKHNSLFPWCTNNDFQKRLL